MKAPLTGKRRTAATPLTRAIDEIVASRVKGTPHIYLSALIQEMRGDATPAQVQAAVDRLAAAGRITVEAYGGGVLLQGVR